MHWALLGAAVVLCLAAGLLVAAVLLARVQEQHVVAARLDPRSAAVDDARVPEEPARGRQPSGPWQRLRGWLSRRSLEAELDLVLRRAGTVRATDRAALGFAVRLFPGLVLVLGVLLALATPGGVDLDTVLVIVLATLAAAVAPGQLLRFMARARQARIRDQVAEVVQLLRLLFDAGQSLENALRTVAREGRQLAPELCRELEIALQRVSAGLALPEALDDMARILAVEELDDTALILKQLARQGGPAREPLQRLVELIEDRQQTRVQEAVSRMATKMSAVMVLFMFPALIILLAAPGFVALFGALGEIGG